MQAQICIEASFAGSTVVFAVDMKPSHDGLREGWSLPSLKHTIASVVTPTTQLTQRNGSAHVLAGTSRCASGRRIRTSLSSGHDASSRLNNSPDLSITCIYDSELASDSDSCPLEADLLTQLQPHVRRLLSARLRVRITTAAARPRQHRRIEDRLQCESPIHEPRWAHPA